MTDPKAPTTPPGGYVNFLRVAHARSEFLLAFGQRAPGQGQTAHLISALVTTPEHAKAMLRALEASIARHEEQFGEIPASEPQPAAASKGEDRAAAGSSRRPPRRGRRQAG